MSKRKLDNVEMSSTKVDMDNDMDELCETMVSHGKLEGYLLKDVGHCQFADTMVIVHTASTFVVMNNTKDNFLYVSDYTVSDAMYNATEPKKLDTSYGYDYHDLPLFSSSDTFTTAEETAPQRVFACCDNIGQVRVWDVSNQTLVLSLQCTASPGDASSKLVHPSAFCITSTHMVIVVSKSTSSVVYYRELIWGLLTSDELKCNAVDFCMKRHLSCPETATLTSSDGIVMNMLVSKLHHIQCVTANPPHTPSLFYITHAGGIASVNFNLPASLRLLLPALEYPGYIDVKYAWDDDNVLYKDTTKNKIRVAPERTQTEQEQRISNEHAIKSYSSHILRWLMDPHTHDLANAYNNVFEEHPECIMDCIVSTWVMDNLEKKGDTTSLVAMYVLPLRTRELTSLLGHLGHKNDALMGDWFQRICCESMKAALGITDFHLPKAHMTGCHPTVSDYMYDETLQLVDHSTPVPDSTKETFLDIVFTYCMYWLDRARRDTDLAKEVRRLSVPSLDKEDIPVSFCMVGARNVCVTKNHGVVWLDINEKLAQTKIISHAIHAVPLDEGTVCMCGDGMLRFLEKPEQNTYAEPTGVFLRASKHQSIQRVRKTEQAMGSSMLARINDNTVAAMRYDNNLWFFMTNHIHVVDREDDIPPVWVDEERVYETTIATAPPAEPPVSELTRTETSDVSMEASSCAAPEETTYEPTYTAEEICEAASVLHEDYEYTTIKEGDVIDGVPFTTTVTESAMQLQKKEMDEWYVDPGIDEYVVDVHDTDIDEMLVRAQEIRAQTFKSRNEPGPAASDDQSMPSPE